MSAALKMALRVQHAIDELAALKARTDEEIRQEERLADRLDKLLAPLIDEVDEHVRQQGLPDDDGAAALMLVSTVELEQQLVEILAEELGDEALAAMDEVAKFVSTKSLGDDLRPFGMDRKLFDTVSRLGGRMLTRFTSRTVDALVNAAAVDLPVDTLRSTLSEMLTNEVSQLSRHALGDVRNEATEIAEFDLGVTHHRWVTAGDENVRPAHADVDGEIVRVGERFSNGWRRPGGVGCRCRLEPYEVRSADEQPLPPGWERDADGNIVRS